MRGSADGALVVHHDVAIAGVGADRVAPGGRPAPPCAAPRAAIDACGDLVVNIELKDLPGEPGYDPGYPLARLVARFVVRSRAWRGRVIVSSFDLLALDAALDAEPALVTGWLTPRWFDQVDALETLVGRGHRALHPHHEAVTEALVAAAHEAGITVTTWTADDPTASASWPADRRCDAIITNVPDVARAALEAAEVGRSLS